MSSSALQVFEWAGAALGMLGALLLSLNIRISRYGWISFALANIAMVVFAIGINAYGLLAQQLFFSLTSTIGIARSFLSPGTRRT
jgi:hypothetical protein